MLLAVTDTTINQAELEVQVLSVVRKVLLDLAGKFLGGCNDQCPGVAVLLEALQSGNAKAAVFPVPVWADPMMSLPARMWGMDCSWMGSVRCIPAPAGRRGFPSGVGDLEIACFEKVLLDGGSPMQNTNLDYPGSYRGRIAPTPSGLLHTGHARTFWMAWHRCRAASGNLIYRNEDSTHCVARLI